MMKTIRLILDYQRITCMVLITICCNSSIFAQVWQYIPYEYWNPSLSYFLTLDKSSLSPSFYLFKHNSKYYFVVNLRSKEGYYDIDVEEMPYAYFKDDKGETVRLKFNEENPIFNIYIDVNKDKYTEPFVIRYETNLVYAIDDIDEFLSHNYVKYSFCNGFVGLDMASDAPRRIKKFNKNLQIARKAVETRKKNYSSYEFWKRYHCTSVKTSIFEDVR